MLASTRPEPWRWADKRKAPGAKEWRKSLAIERRYARQLRQIAREVGRIVEAYPEGDPQAVPLVEAQLNEYARLLHPWSIANAKVLWTKLDIQDFRHWRRHAKRMERELVREVAGAPVGQLFKDFMDEQVDLITSIPRKAASRVHELVLQGMEDATRASEIAAEIRRTNEVTQARATLIARTEIARGQSLLTQVRAEHVGSEVYIWRTMQDFAVRKQHRKLEGKIIHWDEPPVAGTGRGGAAMRYHAGQGPNCRCYPEPIIPDDV